MSSTSASVTETKRAPSSPATARAMKVLPQPGGPYRSRPPRSDLPYSLRSSGLRIGARKAASSRPLTSSMPATSASSRCARSRGRTARSPEPARPPRRTSARSRRRALLRPAASRRPVAATAAQAELGGGGGIVGTAPARLRMRVIARSEPGSRASTAESWSSAPGVSPAVAISSATCSRSGTSSGEASTAASRLAIRGECSANGTLSRTGLQHASSQLPST